MELIYGLIINNEHSLDAACETPIPDKTYFGYLPSALQSC